MRSSCSGVKAASLIFDLDIGSRIVGARLHGDVSAAMLERIADEVRDDLLQPAAVALDDRGGALNAHPIDPPPRPDGGIHQGSKVDRLEPDGSLAGVEAGDLHQVFDEATEAGYIRDDELGRAASLGRHPVEMLREKRGFGDQGGDGRSELVCNVRGKPPFARLRL